MAKFVNIKKGLYRQFPVAGTFQVAKDLTPGKKGNYITVETKGAMPFLIAKARIRIADVATDVEYFDVADEPASVPVTAEMILTAVGVSAETTAN